MFKTSKPLIATPRDSKAKGSNEFEFTPIGEEKRNENRGTIKSKPTTNRRSGTIDGLLKQRRNPLNNSPLLNRLHGGSSFVEDSSFEHLSNSATKPTTSPVNNDFHQHDLLINGSNPVRLQQENVSKLQDENYNLKVKIASLTRFLNSVTNDEQQEIYQQNSELQEKLIEMRGEISSLNFELSSLKQRKASTSSVEADKTSQKVRAEIIELNHVIKALEDSNSQMKSENSSLLNRISDLEGSIKHLEEEKDLHAKESSPVSKSYVHSLESKIQSLSDEVEDHQHDIRRKEELIDELDEKVEDLEGELRKLHQGSHKQSEINDIAESQLDELKYIIKDRDQQIAKLESTLEEKHAEAESLNSKLRSVEKVCNEEHKERRNFENLSNTLQKKVQLLEKETSTISTSSDYQENEVKRLKNNQIALEDEIERLKIRLEESKSIISEQKKLIEELRGTEYEKEELDLQRQTLKKDINNLQKELHKAQLERDSSLKRISNLDQEIILLRNNNERTFKAYNDLKKSSQGQSRHDKNNHLQNELDQLSNRVQDLKIENQQLHKNLEMEKQVKNNRDSYDKYEVKSLSAKCNELQLELSEKDYKLSKITGKFQNEIDSYKQELREKQEELIRTKEKLKSLEIHSYKELDDEKVELIKAKNASENKARILALDLQNLKEQNEAEIKVLKSTIERLRSSSNSIYTPYQSTDSYVADLVRKVQEKNSKIKLLNEKLLQTIGDTNDLELSLKRVEQSKSIIEQKNLDLKARLKTLESKVEAYRDKLSQVHDWESSEIESLRSSIRSKNIELENANKEYNQMKHDLFEKYRSVADEKLILGSKLEKIVGKYRQLQNTVNVNYEVNSTKKISFLQDQSDYYRMKYTKGSYVINDLKFVNSFMLKSIQATNSHIKKDIKKLQNVGIYPDYELICTKKLKLSVLFKFVVAAIRIRRKTQHSSTKNKKLEKLQTKLELIEY